MKIVSPAPGEIESQSASLEVEVTDQGGGIKMPWIMQNGSQVLVDATKQATGNILRESFKIRLVPGENRIEVRAASADGSWESEPATLVLSYHKSLVNPTIYLVAVGVDFTTRKLQWTSNTRLAMPRRWPISSTSAARSFTARGE